MKSVMDLILISVSYLLLKIIYPAPRGAALSWSWWMPKAPQDPQGTPGLLTHLSEDPSLSIFLVLCNKAVLSVC